MKVLDLCSGIGGFSLGLEWAGMETIAFCEKEPYPLSKLKKNWPDIPRFRDIYKLNKRTLDNAGLKSIQLISAGFPCQPYSVAGKQRGKEDDRDLWPEVFRLIKEIRPNWFIGENVAGFITMALDDVLFDLESEGYTTQTFVIPACAVGGFHKRDRAWIIAHTDNKRQSQQQKQQQKSRRRIVNSSQATVSNAQHNGSSVCEKQGSNGETICNNQERQELSRESQRVCSSSNVANSKGKRLQRIGPGPKTRRTKKSFQGSGFTRSRSQTGFRPIQPPTECPVRHRDDGLPDNVARLKALGNAVVPQIPELIGRAITEIENGAK